METLKCFWRFICRRDSESAVCVCIDMAEVMTDRDLREMRDYFNELWKNKGAER